MLLHKTDGTTVNIKYYEIESVHKNHEGKTFVWCSDGKALIVKQSIAQVKSLMIQDKRKQQLELSL